MAIWRCGVCGANPLDYTEGCEGCERRKAEVAAARLGNCSDCNEVTQQSQLDELQGRCLGCHWKFKTAHVGMSAKHQRPDPDCPYCHGTGARRFDEYASEVCPCAQVGVDTLLLNLVAEASGTSVAQTEAYRAARKYLCEVVTANAETPA